MAALRGRKVRTLTWRPASGRGESWRAKKKYTRHIEVVATTQKEAESGAFQKVGDIFAFKPSSEAAMSILWDRIRHMDRPEYREVFYNKLSGIRTFIRHFIGMRFPSKMPEGLSPFPVGLLEYAIQDTSVARPMGQTSIEREEIKTVRYPYLEIVRDKWIPTFLLKNYTDKAGLFPNTRKAQSVAAVYGIEVDPYASSEKWIRSSTPDVMAEAERSIQIDEEVFQHHKQSIISMAETLAAAGKTFSPDWEAFKRAISKDMGVLAGPFTDRLKLELTPILQSIVTQADRYQENRSIRGHSKHHV